MLQSQKSKLAKMLVEAAGADHFKRVFFTNGGAESNENAIKNGTYGNRKNKSILML